MILRYLFNSKTIAVVALIIIAIIAIITIMLTMGSGENMSEIEKAAKTSRNVFIVYILFLVATVILSIFVWITSNKYQDAVKADADVKIKIAEAVSETAKKEAAKANEKAEAERLARLQLEARLAGRILTEEQQTQLISTLRPFSGTEVNVLTFGDIPEIGTIGMIIINCMQNAGWNVHSGNAPGGGGIARGILVGIRPNSDIIILNAARALISTLGSLGIMVNPWDFDKLVYPDVMFGNFVTMNTPVKIFIGSKP